MKKVSFTTALNFLILLIGFIGFNLPNPHNKIMAQTSTEHPQISEDQPSDQITDSEKEQPETPMDEEERMKREEELNKYCESAPDDPQCE